MPDRAHAVNEPPRMAELLDIAARLFNEKGYRAASLTDIGGEIGMNKASLYYYVKSKDDLLARVIYRASQRLRALADGISDDTQDPQTALVRLVETHCHTLLDHPDEFGTVIFQRRHISTVVLPEIADRERAYFDAVRALIARGVESGAFRPMDSGIATQILLDVMNGILRWYGPDGRLDRDAAVKEVTGFAETALLRETA
jgi:AcrR family transcriptional regulator